VTPRLAEELEKNPQQHHLLVFEDDRGIEVGDVSTASVPAHQLLSSLIEQGAVGAAYATYLPARSEVLAEIYVGTAKPEDSDVRRATVTRSTDGVVIGPWQHAITG
jgi:hypothetical protein